MVFHRYFQAGKKEEFRQKIYPFFTSPMAIVDFWTNKYRLDSLFGIQLFCAIWGGGLSAAEFCYGIRFIVLVLG